MFVGTGSDVGKSMIGAGFCRILKQDGYTPAPFKAQNMSLNSYATPDGLEIGRAQAVQAEACKIPCSTDMNPILLKPTSASGSQLVLHGKPVGQQTASEYFFGNAPNALFKEAKLAFLRLQKKFNPVVLEGAGSIAELNLKQRDFTNMRMAIEADAATYLVADIERGGVFASLYGSIALLDEAERNQIKGIIINKFRGSLSLFEEGKKQIEQLTKKPVMGILPYFNNVFIEDEDSVSLEQKSKKHRKNAINVAVVLLRRMANFTDFLALEHDPRLHLYYSRDPQELAQADVMILPGSKNTISDLQDLKNRGIFKLILDARGKGKKIIGICGGYQMMGTCIEDPYGIEGNCKKISGLGLLPIQTSITKTKLTEQCEFYFKNYETKCKGYEIHMGETKSSISGKTLNQFTNQKKEGFLQDNFCWGSYIHGILDNPVVVDDLLADFDAVNTREFNYMDLKNNQYDKLAQLIREHVNMDLFYQHLAQY